MRGGELILPASFILAGLVLGKGEPVSIQKRASN